LKLEREDEDEGVVFFFLEEEIDEKRFIKEK
jgi:hypothetical protein